MKQAVLILMLGAALVGCAGEPDQSADAGGGDLLKPAPVSGDLQAFDKMVALVDALPVDIMAAVNTAPSERVAGQKANLVAMGAEFEVALRELVELGPWALPTVDTKSFAQSTFEFPEYASAKAASKLLNAYADVVEEGGNPELAARACLTNRMLSQRMLGLNHLLVSHLVGSAIGAISERSLRELAIRGTWSSEDIQVMQGNGAVKDMALKGLVGTLKSEWWNFVMPSIKSTTFPEQADDEKLGELGLDKETLTMLRENKDAFDREATLALGSQYVAAAIREIETTPLDLAESKKFLDSSVSPLLDEEVEREVIHKWLRETPNAMGKFMLSVTLPLFGHASIAAVKNEASRGLSEVVLAANRGKVETGAIPSSFAELSKFGLPEDVVDPYSGRAFGYDAARGLAWSVGPNGVDDGGLDEPEIWTNEANDRVVRLK